MTGELPIALLVGAAVLVGAAILAVVFVGAVIFLWKRKPAGPSREDRLTDLGYTPRPDGTWLYEIQGTQMVFSKRPSGLHWQLRLPRYNTMTLELVESDSPAQLDRAFESGIHAIDERFRLSSPQADRIVALLKQPKLQKALLKTQNLALHLSADELILEDPGGAGMAAIDRPDPVEAELDEHALMINVVNALFGSLYAESGTVLDQFR